MQINTVTFVYIKNNTLHLCFTIVVSKLRIYIYIIPENHSSYIFPCNSFLLPQFSASAA